MPAGFGVIYNRGIATVQGDLAERADNKVSVTGAKRWDLLSIVADNDGWGNQEFDVFTFNDKVYEDCRVTEIEKGEIVLTYRQQSPWVAVTSRLSRG